MHSFGSVGYITTRLARTIKGAIEFINSSYSFFGQLSADRKYEKSWD